MRLDSGCPWYDGGGTAMPTGSFPLTFPPGLVGRAVVFRSFLAARPFPLRACGILAGKAPASCRNVLPKLLCILSGAFSYALIHVGHVVYIQVHFSTFLGHCGNPYGSRRFALQCRWARFVLGRVLWYTCLRPRAIFGLILSVVVVARGFFMPSLRHATPESRIAVLQVS